jgi:hypothetical protein
MPALELFTDFVKSTGPAYLTGPEQIVNEAQLLNYAFLERSIRGREMSEIVQGGESIKDTIIFEGSVSRGGSCVFTRRGLKRRSCSTAARRT